MIVKPTRNTTTTSWTSLVDIFYDRLVLGIRNDDGKVVTRVNGSLVTSSATIPDGQVTILSQIVQPDGSYTIWANNAVVLTGTSAAMTSLVPGVSGSGANGFGTYINVGRNNPDGWTTFSGYIGDVFVYKTALTISERQQIESELTAKFINHTITATAGTGGTISPNGAVSVAPGANQTFTIAPLSGYAVSGVTVDGIGRGAVNSYTFTNVTAAHSISASFVSQPRPTLTLVPNGAGGLEISWPDSYSGTLLTSPVLGPGAVWSPVGGAPVHVGGLYKFSVTPGAAAAFYGLSQ
ncbi:MAG: InlB B-repeat-containing protein [Verrucomicrobiota bacterium]